MHHDDLSFENAIIDKALTKRDLALIRHFFFEPQNPEITRELFAGLTLENLKDEPVYFRVMLAGLGHSTKWDGFPSELLPRFQAIYEHFRKDNEIRIHWLRSILTMFEKGNIPFMMIKGGAMYTFYSDAIPRVMDDYDLAVPEEYFQAACKLLLYAGCTFHGSVPWSDTFESETEGKYVSIDLHRHVFKNVKENDRYIWKNAVQTRTGDVKTLVPAPEDMCLHILDTQIRNFLYNEHPERRIKWLVDWCLIRKAYPDACSPSVLRERSALFHNKYYIQLAFRIISAFLPDVLSPQEVEDSFPLDQGYIQWLKAAESFRQCRSELLSMSDLRSMTPRHLYLSAKRWLSEYRLMGPEMRAQYGRFSLLDYYYLHSGNGNFIGAVKNVLPRLRLNSKH